MYSGVDNLLDDTEKGKMAVDLARVFNITEEFAEQIVSWYLEEMPNLRAEGASPAEVTEAFEEFLGTLTDKNTELINYYEL
jgi:hypothetical protein